MCSRYFLDADGNVIAYTFAVTVDERLRKRFNIAPTQEAPIVRATKDGAGREVAMARWGLVPFWATSLAIGTKMINARSEGVEAKPAFKAAIEKRRCIVPATGFFEWQGVAGRKQPFAVTLPDRHVFGFAGLWERWKPADGDPVESFAIMTTDANDAVAKIHDRMPVILPKDSEDIWLHGNRDQARTLLTPYAGPVNLRPVSRYVSNVNNEGPECLDDAGPSWGSQQSLL
jgi:putative SOS response-associated peptidase YedK